MSNLPSGQGLPGGQGLKVVFFFNPPIPSYEVFFNSYEELDESINKSRLQQVFIFEISDRLDEIPYHHYLMNISTMTKED